MKKIVFAVQVFGLFAMFPVLVILEMNHVTGPVPGNNFTSHPILKIEKTNKSTGIPVETIFLKTAF